MKTHNLKNRQLYPSIHVWQSASKINVFSSVPINKGDQIELDKKTVTVTDVKSQKPSDDSCAKNVLFYEIDFVS